ncbi:TPA: hypothetical protein DEP94_03415 [Candidatus Nomurabacteria bacterium]|nr:hypothetical protein [Candidatus Nomurabacteria bacterium]
MKVEFSHKFKKKISKLPFSIQQKFDVRFLLFCNDPFHPLLHNHSVDPPFTDTRSINITGDYRALFIKEGENYFIFVDIGTHSELYD